MTFNLAGRLAALFFTVLGVVGMTSPTLAESLLERGKKDGFIRVGFTNEQPFSYVTPDGQLVGQDVDIALTVLKEMGINEIDGVLTPWGSLIPALKSGRIDMIAAGMFVNPKRCAEVAFSEPVFGIGEAFLVKEGNPKNLLTFEDVAKDKSVNLGVLAGSSEVDYAKLAGIDSSQVHVYPDFPTELAAFKSGRLDALAMVAVTAEQQVQKEGPGSGMERTPVIEKIGDNYIKGHGAYAFRKGDEDFVKEFNSHLVKFLGSKEHLDMIAKYGFNKGELPEKSTAELCKG